MLVGAPIAGNKIDQTRWQIYEVTGLGDANKKQIVQIGESKHKIRNTTTSHQFTTPTTTSFLLQIDHELDKHICIPNSTNTRRHRVSLGYGSYIVMDSCNLLSHTPSGAFQPIIDRFGRVLFTRWDHLQQDQLADRDRDASRNESSSHSARDFASEAKMPSRFHIAMRFFLVARRRYRGLYGTVSAYTIISSRSGWGWWQ